MKIVCLVIMVWMMTRYGIFSSKRWSIIIIIINFFPFFELNKIAAFDDDDDDDNDIKLNWMINYPICSIKNKKKIIQFKEISDEEKNFFENETKHLLLMYYCWVMQKNFRPFYPCWFNIIFPSFDLMMISISLYKKL